MNRPTPFGSGSGSRKSAARTVALVVPGCVVGIAFYWAATATAPHGASPAEPAEEARIDSGSSVVRLDPGALRPVALQVRRVSIEAPSNPFQPSEAAPPAISVVPQTVATATTATDVRVAERRSSAPGNEVTAPERAAAPQQEAATATSAVPDLKSELTLTGVIEGDPSLAVVRYDGQVFYLKTGEKLADSWQLVEIRERSAIFQAGTRKVEIPIQGGS
jgi:hypothetical protein